MNKTKFAVGCFVQWYEIEIIPEYIDSLVKAVNHYGKDHMLIDFTLSTNQDLEKIVNSKSMLDIVNSFNLQMDKLADFNTNIEITNELTTIADYRRRFNSNYATKADVLMWGESDMLIPRVAFEVQDNLYKLAPTKKFVSTFGICKMWDDSWKVLEHPEFTNKPFIENDYKNWWSLKYTMSQKEMEEINNRTQSIEVKSLQKLKFNGCGLLISSEIIKVGVNIPQSVFFVHEDTAFMLMLQRILGNVQQYAVSGILNVHNRNHPKKRMYVKNESGDTMNQKRRSNDWYVKANKYSEENCYNLFNPDHISKTWNDVWK